MAVVFVTEMPVAPDQPDKSSAVQPGLGGQSTVGLVRTSSHLIPAMSHALISTKEKSLLHTMKTKLDKVQMGPIITQTQCPTGQGCLLHIKNGHEFALSAEGVGLTQSNCML